ncbi:MULTISPECIES: hypothetical protein [Cupriavidus]|uniref:DUF4926 domain-containing protein n=1 Tax=Cupriavidus pauculus TaxID=82633 RepID=A0A3G8H2X4_9BURK|nr:MULTISPECIES: hypothetical protein [Cupriavidus]AZG14861.1 hypothetical protein EHF44_16315 [Cupriavidus pauculus]MDT6962851.1 hypothetical protein [Cupriavidus sp. SZY C1]
MTIATFNHVRYIGPDDRTPGVRFGDIGYVTKDHDDGSFEVEFSYRDGMIRFLAVILGRDLERADKWLDPV